MVDRAMDLAGIAYHGIPIGWHSAAGFRNPWLHETDAEDGFGWFRSMSGLMNSCGLDHIHAPERDSADHFNHPPRPTIQHGLHGRISMIPAELSGYGERWEGDRCILYAEGRIRQATVFGENLELKRRIEIEVGSDRICFYDQVSNLGFAPTPHVYLWHINMGWPLLDDGAEVWGLDADPVWQMRPTEDQDGGYYRQTAPFDETTQQVFEHRPPIAKSGLAHVALANADFSNERNKGLALEVAYDAEAMPALFQWQNFKKGHQVMALEPCTTHAGTRADWHQRDEFKWLSHGDSIDYRLELTPHLGASAFEALKQRLHS